MAAKASYEVGYYQRIRTIAGKGDLLNNYNHHRNTGLHRRRPAVYPLDQ